MQFCYIWGKYFRGREGNINVIVTNRGWLHQEDKTNSWLSVLKNANAKHAENNNTMSKLWIWAPHSIFSLHLTKRVISWRLLMLYFTFVPWFSSCSVLVSFGVEVIFFLISSAVLCFGLSMRIMWDNTKMLQLLLSSASPKSRTF